MKKENTTVCTIGLLSVYLGWLTTYYLLDSDSFFLIMLLFFAYFLIFYLIRYIIKKPAQKAKEADALQIKFYEECTEKGIEELSSAANRQKAELIAQKLGCKGYESLDRYFENSKRAFIEKRKQDKIAKENAELEELHKAEKDKYRELTKYSNYAGRNKRVAILTDQRAAYTKKADNLRKGMDIVLSDSQQEEIDWATLGGIASGIAGGAAGVAVAMDAQIKNAEIRAQNRKNLEALLPYQPKVLESAREYEDAAKKINVAIDEAKIKLVTDTPKEKVLDRLYINLVKLSISKTGAFTIQASVKLKEDFVIFDNIPAVVDGTICADLYQKGNKVGSALLVLPTFGIGKTTGTIIQGISLDKALRDIPYEVEFTPYLLWEMEK